MLDSVPVHPGGPLRRGRRSWRWWGGIEVSLWIAEQVRNGIKKPQRQ
ncbi:MAG: hypothetical protein FWF18_00265 [Dehalococcoidia bacterium]|nr:hypothetical protein [Dehalococcoidia bacterium]